MSETSTIRNESLSAYLLNQLGREVIAEFQCGQDDIVRKAGVLKDVQPDFIVLRDDMNLRDVLCSMEHLCFITFYLSGTMQGDTNDSSRDFSDTATAVQPVSSINRGFGGAALSAIRKGRKPD